MGSNTSKPSGAEGLAPHSAHHTHQRIKDLVDLGSVLPNGIYPTAQQDYDLRAVRNLILKRKLAPFYKGLPDPPEPVLPIKPVAREALLEAPVPMGSTSMTTLAPPPSKRNHHDNTTTTRPRSASSCSAVGANPRTQPLSKSHHHQQQQQLGQNPVAERQIRLDRMRLREQMLYNDAVECPICFLYYPSNINFARCCGQPICTECFVQIKRPPESQTTPATCPFCMQENFGVIYRPPLWSENLKSGSLDTIEDLAIADKGQGTRHTTSGISDDIQPRRSTISAKDPNVVLVDQVRPNWNHLPPPSSNARGSRSRSNSSAQTLLTVPTARTTTRSGRSASSAATTGYGQFLTSMQEMDMDLEEWMVTEAIRRSLADQQDSATTTTTSTTTNTTISPSSRSPPPSVQVTRDDDDNEPLYNTARRLRQESSSSATSPSAEAVDDESSHPQSALPGGAGDNNKTSLDLPSNENSKNNAHSTNVIC